MSLPDEFFAETASVSPDFAAAMFLYGSAVGHDVPLEDD